jgi:flagellar motor switch protein FliM
MSNILSQDEVDALLQGISGGEIETESDSDTPSEVSPFDWASQDRAALGNLGALDVIHDRFARMFRATLSGSLRKLIGFSPSYSDTMKFRDFQKILSVPASLHIFRLEPLKGQGLLAIEARLVYVFLDLFFGGKGRFSVDVEGKEFTAIENELIKRVALDVLADLEKAWRPYQPMSMSLLLTETNPQFVAIVPPNEFVMVAVFQVDIGGETGTISFCIPYACLEPIRDKLQSGFHDSQATGDDAWSRHFRERLAEVEVEVAAQLGSADVSCRDLLRLEVGDVITLNRSVTDELAVEVEGIMKFKGHPGNFNGSQAIQVSTVAERRPRHG